MNILSVLDRLIQWDKDIFIKLHEVNSAWLDPFMVFISAMSTWYATALLVVVFLIWRYGRMGAWASLFMALTVGFNAGLNNLVKYTIMRPRPINTDGLSDLVRALEGYDASYSFYSGHTTNSFCLAVFSMLVVKNKWYSLLIIFWAVIVAYSRIYVGKHYPLDLIVGFFVGVFVGWVGYLIFDNFRNKKLQPQI